VMSRPLKCCSAPTLLRETFYKAAGWEVGLSCESVGMQIWTGVVYIRIKFVIYVPGSMVVRRGTMFYGPALL